MKQILTCCCCEKVFYRKVSLTNWREGGPVFCSRACANQRRRSSPGPRRILILANQLLETHPDWTQTRIAEEVGVSKQAVNKWFKQGT
jgi:hypothetical protein